MPQMHETQQHLFLDTPAGLSMVTVLRGQERRWAQQRLSADDAPLPLRAVEAWLESPDQDPLRQGLAQHPQ